MRKRLLTGLVAVASTLALTATAAPAYAQDLALNRASYLAIGDSYTSGALLGGDLDQECDRSSAAYPVVLAGDAGNVTLQACSGDDIQDVLDDLPRPRPNVKTITLTLGAQDTAWQELALQCALGSPECSREAAEAYIAQLAVLRTQIVPTIEAINQAYPKATIFWGGYVVPTTPQANCTVTGVLPDGTPYDLDLDPVRAAGVNTLVLALNQTIADGVAEAEVDGLPVAYVDANPGFEGHRYCDEDPWLANLHPTAEGQQAYATAFEAAGVGDRDLLRQAAQDRAAERRADAAAKRANR